MKHLHYLCSSSKTEAMTKCTNFIKIILRLYNKEKCILFKEREGTQIKTLLISSFYFL